ncbi:MAG: hypothetical protein DLM60_22270 [Pseudonocardiales bacterium]|nr:MAG: hypothetical protein DLM60_22270 [Pseudonocardiales bacterium]
MGCPLICSVSCCRWVVHCTPTRCAGRSKPPRSVSAEESREQIVGLCHRAWAHSDATIDTLALDAIGHVPWWPGDRNEVTLHRILVHVIAETHRHVGHADIVREIIDGAVGMGEDNENMAPGGAGAGEEPSWSIRRADALEPCPAYRDRAHRNVRSHRDRYSNESDRSVDGVTAETRQWCWLSRISLW